MEPVVLAWFGVFFLCQVPSCVFAKEPHSHSAAGVQNSVRKRDEHVYSQRDNHMEFVVNTAPQLEAPFDLMVEFPSISAGRRVKREWVIPPYTISENQRGPFPFIMFQIKANLGVPDSEVRYSISGEGADQPPNGVFIIKATADTKYAWFLYVTQPLDREMKSQYMLLAHATAFNGAKATPTNITILVGDQNDNKPIFTQNPFNGQVSESAPIGYEFLTVTATDADEPNTDNSDVRYKIISQTPPLPYPNMFSIDNETGKIYVSSSGLDKEQLPRYTLEIWAADNKGEGNPISGTAVITITDSNDNAPQFDQTLHNVSVPENKVGAVVAKLTVTDGDEPESPAWSTKYQIINGDRGGFFNISTGPSQLEGIITTVKPLDFEKSKKYILSVIVENDEPFVGPLSTSTATVTVNVEDVNEPPEFNPKEKTIHKPEDTPVDSVLVSYTATDPDIEKSQKITYKISSDPDHWLSVIPETGDIKVKNPMDRESSMVKDGKYRAIILAIDNDKNPATGTGTLVIELEDVNDNAPDIKEKTLEICNREPVPVLLSVTDKDGPSHGAPFSVEVQGDTKKSWDASMNATRTGILLKLTSWLDGGRDYDVVLSVSDYGGMSNYSTIKATVCDCKGEEVVCINKVAGIPLYGVFGVLGAILALLLFLLLLLLFMRRKRRTIKDPLISEEDDVRDNIYCYDEEGGGEDDQDYDLEVLHRGLDNRPRLLRGIDVPPVFMPSPQYRPRPANNEEIFTFIGDNLKAADNDHRAPPYDSLLVFDYEGEGSDAGSLSSLNSSSSGHDEDYDFLNEWGSRFKKLADMYGGGED